MRSARRRPSGHTPLLLEPPRPSAWTHPRTEEALTSQMTEQIPLARSSNFRRALARSEKCVWGSFLLIPAVSPGLCR